MSYKFTPEERRRLADIFGDASVILIDVVQGDPIEEIQEICDRIGKDLEAQRENRLVLDEILNRPDFKEFERRMIADAKAHLADFETLESRMMVTTSSERAEFYHMQKYAPRFLSNLVETPWLRQLQIDMDYAKHCAILDNRPTFLSWCINQSITKEAMPCFTII